MPENAAIEAAVVTGGDATPPLHVLIIGAGFSGVCAGVRLLQQGESDFVIVEKSNGIGGTWYDNTYPGATCDVPSHFYCFSFEPNPDWSRKYPSQPEIQAYIEHCVDKYALRPHIRHGKRLLELTLLEARGLWQARFEDGSCMLARHVINGAGGLHKPAYPAIPGRDRFRGPSMHTARWDHGVDFASKRVAVIGSAASAIQVIPELAGIAQSVVVFQRTPNYIAPRKDREYSAAEKRRFARWPWFARLYRWLILMRMDLLLFPVTRRNSRLGRRGGRRLKAHVRDAVARPELHAHLEPDYQLGCKRILISDDYYATLNRDNVELVPHAVSAIGEHGLTSTDGKAYDADVIVYATGFDIDAHMRAIVITGENGKALADTWSDGQEAYRGAVASGFPNYYMVTGPNTGVSTTSVVFMIEKQVDYILQMIARAGTAHLITVSAEAQVAYNTRIHAALAESVWSSGCMSWYRRPDGKITTLYPFNARTFAAQTRRFEPAHFRLRPVIESAQLPLHVRHSHEDCSACSTGLASANGQRLAWELHGRADAPVVLLVHGLGIPLSGWPPALVDGLLDAGYRVLMFDNRDIGRSGLASGAPRAHLGTQYLRSWLGLPVRAPYRLDDMAQDATGLLDVLGIESAHVVGVSMGGMIAQLMAINARERVNSLTSIMSTTGNRKLPGPVPEVRRHMLSRPSDASQEERIAHGIRTWELIGSKRWAKSADETRAFIEGLYDRGVTADGVLRQMLAIMAAPSRVAGLARVSVPALVIHGALDPLVPPACGEDTAAALPDATLHVFEDMGHDLPDALLPQIAELICTHAAAAERQHGACRAA